MFEEDIALSKSNKYLVSTLLWVQRSIRKRNMQTIFSSVFLVSYGLVPGPLVDCLSQDPQKSTP